MPRLLREAAAGVPGEPRVVEVVVEAALELRASRARAHERRLVRLRPRPVRRGRTARAVGEAQADRDAPPPDEGRDDPYRDEVQARVAERLHRHLLPVEAEAAAERAVPQVEHLLDVGEVVAGRLAPVGVREAEADAAEVQPVRVGPQPLDLRRPSVARDVRVADLPPVRVELREAEPLDRPAGRVRGGVPAPLRERAERDRLVVGLGEGLEAGRVGGECELAVPDRQGRLRVEGPQDRAVAIDEGPPVDRGRRRRGAGRHQRGGQGDGGWLQETTAAAKARPWISAAAPRSRGCSPSGTVRISVSPVSRITASSRSVSRTVGASRSQTAVISPPT